MTQQFDLAFKTSNSMDKMMSNTTSSPFTSKGNQKEIGSQFGSFLENANKNYSKPLSSNDNTRTENKFKQNKGEKTSFESNKSNDNDAKTSVNKNANNTKNEVKNNESSVKENTYDRKFEEKTVETEQVNLQSNEIVSNESLELEEMELVEEPLKEVLLSLNTLPNIEIDTDFDSVASASLKMETSVLSEDDIPADALKSGIKFDKMFTQSENATAEEINAIGDLTKDIVAAKEDYISAMYKSDNNDKEAVSLTKNDTNLVSDTDVLKVSNVKTEVVKEEISLNMQPELVKDEKVTVISDKVQEEQIPEAKTAGTNDVLSNSKDGNIIAENKTEIQNFEKDIKEDTLKTSNDIKVENVSVKDNEVECQVKNEEKQGVQGTKNDKTEDVVLVQEKPQVAEHQITEAVVATNTLKQNVKAELQTEQSSEKSDVLKQELASAKLENSANLAQQDNSEKQTSDEFAKTNVDAQERMDIKDDVKGIEFVNNKFEEKQEVKNEDNQPASDVKETKVKQKVEQVKMQVEDDVKAQLQNQKFTSDENKMLRANETLEKAGLSTENLQKMNAKIKEVDNSAKTYQTDLGQSSREDMMRDIMQNNASVSNSESVELKVDFNQGLNKLSQANNLQIPRQLTEDLPEVNILEQIRSKMALNSQNGMQKITIGLTPESLGKLNIEISKGQNGISAQIVADNPQAKEILDKNLDGLKSVLQSQGVNVNNVNVKVAEAGRSSDSNNNMFNKEDGHYDSNNNGGNSKNHEDAEKEKRSSYEFLQNEAMKNEMPDEPEQVIERAMQTEKTVSVKSGFGNVSYKM